MASCPDSDNSWVLASSENLPVETLGPQSRMDLTSEGVPPPPQDPSKADEPLAETLDGEGTPFHMEHSQNEGATLPKGETKVSSNGCGTEPPPGDTVVQEDLQETPVVTSLGPDTQDLEDETSPQNVPSSPKAVWGRAEGRCSSSDDDTDVDVEGLRRRWGREPSPPQPPAPVGVEDQPRGKGVGGELGISLNMCLLGALVLLGLGVLLFSGECALPTGHMEEAEVQVFPDTGLETELVDALDHSQEQLQASVPLDSGVPSLQSMGLLLDRLAKENQDIRLLQAQLQAQKEELQNLMHQPKGLEEENAQLRGALRQGEASQRALESELQQLRARLQGLEAGCVRGTDGVCLSWDRGPQGGQATKDQGHRSQGPDASFLEQQKRLEAEAQGLRQDLQRQRELLESVQQDLRRGLRGVGKGAPTHAGLAELGHRLAQTLKGLENWGGDRGVPANASEAWRHKPRSQSPRERSGKEKWREEQKDPKAEPWKPRKGDPGWERKKSWGLEEDRRPAGRWKESKPSMEKWRGRKDAKHQDPGAPPRKSSPSGERQLPPLSPWEELLRRKYRPPQGCSGVQECARQEGLALFGSELAPVQRQELASLLRTYLARLPWAGPLTEELPLSPAYFGEDGIFRHDRLRFRDFVDALEDSLEEVAVRWTGDDEEVDDFEDFIFRHYFGDRALKRSGKKDKHSRSPRVMGPGEAHSQHSQRG
uniref:Pre B cell leukemia transcription factor interacting protein 1 n=1 Tax=Jaculus jaculus TaxID=51337 RepID=A0A8C5KCK7_JACJA